MANQQLYSVITIFNVPFSESDNMIFDNNNYMNDSSIKTVITLQSYQFVKPALDVEIKISLKNAAEAGYMPYVFKNLANYCRILDFMGYDTTTYATSSRDQLYYYVREVRIIDTDSVLLVLHMDVLNTLVYHTAGVSSASLPWNDNTHILRQHKDRYMKVSGQTYLWPKVDYRSEGITVNKVSSSSTAIEHSNSYARNSWYIVYKTRYSSGDSSHPENPLSTYFVPSGPFEIYGSSSQRVTSADLDSGLYYWFMSDDDNINGFIGLSSTVGYTLGSASGSNYIVGVIVQIYSTGELVIRRVYGNATKYANCTASSISVEAVPSHPFTLSSETVYLSGIVKGYVLASDDAIAPGLFSSSWIDLYYVGGATRHVITIDEVNRSNSRILKIVRVPYPPFAVEGSYDSSTSAYALTLPSWLSYQGGYLKANSENFLPDSTNLSLTVNSMSIPYYTYLANTVYPATLEDAEENTILSNVFQEEPKLFHSDFFDVKFVFDSFSYDFAIERFDFNTYSTLTVALPNVLSINFIPSLNISSTFMFRIQPDTRLTYKAASDYEGYFAVKRNNELPLYTASYLEYIRTGFNYDMKARALQESAQVAQLVISSVGAIASFAAAGATGGVSAAAGIGFATSAVSSVASLGTTISNNNIAMANKMAELQSQGASVSGSDDLDLLMNYSPKLQYRIYQPWAEEQQRICDYLRLRGYIDDEYAVPDTHTRLYYNFVQCEADFDALPTKGMLHTFPTDNFMEEIKSKFREGVYFMHNPGSGYDFHFQYENWETSLFN